MERPGSREGDKILLASTNEVAIGSESLNSQCLDLKERGNDEEKPQGNRKVEDEEEEEEEEDDGGLGSVNGAKAKSAVSDRSGDGSTGLKIGIIGAGPSGLCCIKWCLAHGLEPIAFEQTGTFITI
jgi:hypothetical protein